MSKNYSDEIYQYRLRVLDDDAKLTDPDEGDEEEVRSGERDAVLYLEYWGGKGLNSLCKITLNNKKSSWKDLKRFILLCNYAVMTRQTEQIDEEKLESFFEKQLEINFSVSQKNIERMYAPGGVGRLNDLANFSHREDVRRKC